MLTRTGSPEVWVRATSTPGIAIPAAVGISKKLGICQNSKVDDCSPASVFFKSLRLDSQFVPSGEARRFRLL